MVTDERDERLPLLRTEAEIANTTSQQDTIEPAAQRWTKADIACFSILGLVALCVTAVIIKGFLDAGDVDVCSVSSTLCESAKQALV